MNFVDLREAFLCSDCLALGDSANRCPRCQSDALLRLTRALPVHQDHIRLVCDAKLLPLPESVWYRPNIYGRVSMSESPALVAG